MLKTYLKIAACVASVLFVLWCAVSFFDIISHNLTTGVYWKYNAFVVLTKIK